MNDKQKPKAPAKQDDLIRLDDLLPRKNVKGGKGKPGVIFGSLENRSRRRPGSGL